MTLQQVAEAQRWAKEWRPGGGASRPEPDSARQSVGSPPARVIREAQELLATGPGRAVRSVTRGLGSVRPNDDRAATLQSFQSERKRSIVCNGTMPAGQGYFTLAARE